MSWKRGVGVGVLSLGALVVLVWLLGLALPQHHVASVETVLSAPPRRVWDTITDFAGSAEWRDDVDRVERVTDEAGVPVVREEGPSGPMAYRIEAFEPPARMVLRIADEDLPFGGAWTYEVIPEAGGTRVRITEDGDVYNPIFRVVSRFFLGHTGTMERYLRDLATRLGEPGATVTAVVVSES